MPVDGLARTVGKNQIFRSYELSSGATPLYNFSNDARLIEWYFTVTGISLDFIELQVVDPLDDYQSVFFHPSPSKAKNFPTRRPH